MHHGAAVSRLVRAQQYGLSGAWVTMQAGACTDSYPRQLHPHHARFRPQCHLAGSILVHGGGSGIGTSAMALAKEANVRCLVTAGRFATRLLCAGLPCERPFEHDTEQRHALRVPV